MKFSQVTKTIMITSLVSSMAFAWGDLGHQTVGEIAQRHLSPKGKKVVEEILGHGPLAEASTFPDLVRSDSDYNEFSSFHCVEIDPRYLGDYSKIPSVLREKRDANTLISGIPEKLFSGMFGTKFSRNQKMDLLRYLVHLVGDVHQPLHVGNGYDRGANWCNVKYQSGKVLKSTNLHSFWDSGIVAEIFYLQKEKDPSYKMPGWKGFKELADLIIKDQKNLKNESVASAPAVEWYKESQALHSKVYIDKNGSVHPAQREYCQRLVKDENGQPVVDARGVAEVVKATLVEVPTSGLDADGTPRTKKEPMSAFADEQYMKDSAEIIKGQIMKAGLRLAYIINEMGQRQYLNGTTDYESVKVKELNELLKEFENSTK